jgi:BON domain
MGTTKDTRGAVQAELEFDPLVDDAGIHVVNINGDVALNGTVPGYPQYLEAATAAQRVAGTRGHGVRAASDRRPDPSWSRPKAPACEQLAELWYRSSRRSEPPIVISLRPE